MAKANPTGQQSERNLVKMVKKYAPFNVTMDGKTYKVIDADQLGGGNPEPKADVKLVVKDGTKTKEIGVSMKKPNFGFFESWMDEAKLKSLLESVGMESTARDTIAKGLKKKAKEKTAEMKSEILNEYKAMKSIVKTINLDKMAKTGNKFKIDALKVSGTEKNTLVKELLKDKSGRFGKATISSTFKIENVYVPLNDLLGRDYQNFLQTVIGGSSANPFQAEFVIVETIPGTLKQDKLIEILNSAQSIKSVVAEYSSSDDVNLKFRLRPITIARAIYSTTNLGKYKKGAKFYGDEDVGISWTVHVTK
jgi:hypothetical protein